MGNPTLALLNPAGAGGAAQSNTVLSIGTDPLPGGSTIAVSGAGSGTSGSTVTISGGSLTVSGAGTGTSTSVVDGNGSLTVSGTGTGSGTIVKNGNGTLTLSGTGTVGGTTITTGGNGTLTLSGASLSTSTTIGTNAGNVSGASTGTIIANGTLTLSGVTDNTFTTFHSGAIQNIIIPESSGSVNLNGYLKFLQGLPNTSAILVLTSSMNLPVNLPVTINTTDPGTAFSDSNTVDSITGSTSGAIFPNGTNIHATFSGTSPALTIANQTGSDLVITPSTAITGGLLISKP